MNELLLTTSSRILIPEIPVDTSPGPQELIDFYDEDMGPGTNKGIFGEVPAEELINGDELASLIGLTDGISQNSTSGWLKFLLDDQILFVAKQPYRHTVSWNQIDAVNAVSGSRIITINGRQYSICLLETLGPLGDTAVAATYDHASTHGSEWNRLMYNVAAPDSRARGSQIGPNWANYSQAAVADGLWLSAGNGRRSLCKEKLPNNSGWCFHRGNSSVSYLGDGNANIANAGTGWRPCLKLVA